MIKCFLTGATGQLGVELQHTCPPDVELKGVSRDALDICQDQVVSEVVGRCRPDIIINCAAYTAVDRAEQESEHAFAVNARGAANIAKAGVKCGARVIHISTDFVFAGTGPVPYRPDDATGPVNLYGASKLEGEKRVFDITRGSCLILRTAWLYSTHGRNFVNTMLRLMKERDFLRVVDDQIGTPTWANGLARAIWKCVTIPDMHGIHHWTDAGVASWYDFAVAIAEEGIALKLLDHSITILPVPTKEYPTPARRPACSVIDTSLTRRVLGLTPPHWRVALRQMLQEYKERSNE